MTESMADIGPSPEMAPPVYTEKCLSYHGRFQKQAMIPVEGDAIPLHKYTT